MRVQTTYQMQAGGHVIITCETDLAGHSMISYLKEADIVPHLRYAAAELERDANRLAEEAIDDAL